VVDGRGVEPLSSTGLPVYQLDGLRRPWCR